MKIEEKNGKINKKYCKNFKFNSYFKYISNQFYTKKQTFNLENVPLDNVDANLVLGDTIPINDNGDITN